MSLLRDGMRAAVVALTMASLSVGGEPPAVATNSNDTLYRRPRDFHREYEADGLNMRRPYERGKFPVVMIHGLWGFPHQWDSIVEDLESDPLVRERFQFWTFSYASGDPIPFSAHLLRQSLRRARRASDPDRTDATYDRMVVIGHSLGGILAKMMARDSGPRLWQTISDRSVDRITGTPEDRRLFREAFCYEAVPEVRRLVFIATPHRGTPIVRGLVRDLGTRVCDRVSRFRLAREALLTQNGADFFLAGFRRQEPTSVVELSWGNPFLMTLCDLGIDPAVRFHSIIADLRNPPAPGAGDGIVPYTSSHLEGAASEELFRGHHICLNDPAVIRETRRILMEHAGLTAIPPASGAGPSRLCLESVPRN